MSLAVITFLTLSYLPITITLVPIPKCCFKKARLKIETPKILSLVAKRKFILFKPVFILMTKGIDSTFPSTITFISSSK